MAEEFGYSTSSAEEIVSRFKTFVEKLMTTETEPLPPTA
jgi:hypothetical protein